MLIKGFVLLIDMVTNFLKLIKSFVLLIDFVTNRTMLAKGGLRAIYLCKVGCPQIHK